MGSSRDDRGAPGSCPSERSWVLVLLVLLLSGLGPCRLRCRQVPSPFTTESGETAAVVGQPKMATPWRPPVLPTAVKSPTATKRSALCARSKTPLSGVADATAGWKDVIWLFTLLMAGL